MSFVKRALLFFVIVNFLLSARISCERAPVEGMWKCVHSTMVA
jgi:hypothetical protein